jgi:hypothetical protein
MSLKRTVRSWRQKERKCGGLSQMKRPGSSCEVPGSTQLIFCRSKGFQSLANLCHNTVKEHFMMKLPEGLDLVVLSVEHFTLSS